MRKALAKGKFVSGFVAIIGRPNVGKSTFLNEVMGRKIAIMSDKPQTTRNRILGVLTQDDAQIIFIDTPGIHKPKHKLGEFMVRVARRTLTEVDLILFMVDAAAPVGEGDNLVAGYVKGAGTPAILVLNKIDRLKKDDLLPAIDNYRRLGEFAEVVPVSALEGDNLDRLVDLVKKYLPEGPKYYPDETVTDQPEMQVVSELVREKVLHLTRDEVPHSVAVVVDEMTERPGGLVYIKAIIYIERDSQRGIIIGEGGRMLREIGKLARADIEGLLGSKIYLDLWVKVKKDWRDREDTLRAMGYREE